MEQAIANGKNLPISTKVAIMVCAYLRGRSFSSAKRILEAAIAEKEAIPFTRFNDGVGHRKGISGPGRYAVNACTLILTLLESAKANAINKGMSEDLKIADIRANKAPSQMRFGRQSRREAKRTHVVVALVEETGTSRAKKTATKAPAKTATKTAAKTAAPSSETKTAAKTATESPAKTAAKSAAKSPAKTAEKEMKQEAKNGS